MLDVQRIMQIRQMLGTMRQQVVETDDKFNELLQQRETLSQEISQKQAALAEVEATITRINQSLAGTVPLVAPVAAQPAPAPAATPTAPPSLGTKRPRNRARPIGEPTTQVIPKVLSALPPTTEAPIKVDTLMERLVPLGIPNDDSAKKRVHKILRDLVAQNQVVPRADPNGSTARLYHRNNTSPQVEAAAFTPPPPSLAARS